MADLIDALLRLDADLAEMKRRFENAERPGTVHEVDPAQHRVRLRIGGSEAEPFLTPWVPYAQTAGAFKFHNPPSPGQQMMFCCPDGDFRQGYAVPFTWSDANPSPSDKGDEHVATFGQTKTTVGTSRLRDEIESAVHEILAQQISSKVGSSLVRVASARVRALSTRIDLN
jgi:phage baseplate assembly protein V